MGYTTLQGRTESSNAISEVMPVLKNNFNELREWTVRLFTAATPQPSLPVYAVNTRIPFQSPLPSQYAAFSTQPAPYVPPPIVPTSPVASPAVVEPGTPVYDDFSADPFCLFPNFLADDPASGLPDFPDPLFPKDPWPQ
jgi:hypothetical protein